MPKAVFTMKLAPELREEFMAEAAADHRPASQVVRELMREYIAARRAAREYGGYLRHKVAIARAEKRAGLHVSNDKVEAEAATRRAELLHRVGTEGR